MRLNAIAPFLLPLANQKFDAMESTRQKKVSKLIQKELADIFLRKNKELAPGKLVTITIVRVSPDLSVAKVYLSVYSPGKNDDLLETINEQKKNIRHQLAMRIKNQIKFIPDLIFYRDDSLDYLERIETLLKP